MRTLRTYGLSPTLPNPFAFSNMSIPKYTNIQICQALCFYIFQYQHTCVFGYSNICVFHYPNMCMPTPIRISTYFEVFAYLCFFRLKIKGITTNIFEYLRIFKYQSMQISENIWVFSCGFQIKILPLHRN